MEVGVYSGIRSEEYHRGPGVSKSILDLVRRSPFHAWAITQAPGRPERETTSSLELGTVVHCAVLEPDRFDREYAEAPAFDRRTKVGKEGAEAWAIANDGKTPLKLDQFHTVQAMRQNVMAHSLASQLLARGEAELSAYWKDADTGVLCRCRPDWLDLARGIIGDLKTTRNADPREFWRSAWEYRYHVQAAYYLDGVRAALEAAGRECPPLTFAVIAVENVYPYCVSVFEFDPELLEEGRREYRLDLNAYAEALRTGEWSAYPAEVNRLRLPPWKQKSQQPVMQECPF